MKGELADALAKTLDDVKWNASYLLKYVKKFII